MQMKLLLILLFLGILPALLVGQSKERLVDTGPGFKGPVGLQLYSLRDQFKNDVPGTLDQVKALGITYVETAGTYGVSEQTFTAETQRRQRQRRGNQAWVRKGFLVGENTWNRIYRQWLRSQVSPSSVAWCSRC